MSDAAQLADQLTERPDEITTDDGITVTIAWDSTWYRSDLSQPRGTASHVEHGHCAKLRDLFGRIDPFAGDPIEEPAVGQQWPYLWQEGKPTQIEGIDEDDMPAAVELLVDTARAHRAWVGARRARRDRTKAVLAKFRDEYAAVIATVEPPHRYMALQRIGIQRNSAVQLALSEALLNDEEIREASGLSEFNLCQQRSYVDYPATPRLVLDDAGFAARLGISVSSLRSYKSRGRIPEADAPLGGSDGWTLELVEAYMKGRPRQGARTDLTAD